MEQRVAGTVDGEARRGTQRTGRGIFAGVILPGDMAESDTDVIEAVLAGDVDRYAELVDRYQRQTLKVAFSLLGNYDDARDASQDAFVRAYQALPRFKRRAKFSTWFYRIVVNACRDVQRRRARQPQVAARLGEANPDVDEACLFVDVDDPAASPSDRVANRELGHRLTVVIEELPMKQRCAFVLHHVHGLPLAEVAEVMGCRVGTVKTHVFRATESLRMRLAPWLTKEGR